jgi:hypothetical protein
MWAASLGGAGAGEVASSAEPVRPGSKARAAQRLGRIRFMERVREWVGQDPGTKVQVVKIGGSGWPR